MNKDNNIRYCRYCGKQIDADSTFCVHCGKPQGVTAHPINMGNAKAFSLSFINWITKCLLKIRGFFKISKISEENSKHNKFKKWMKRIFISFVSLVAIGLLILLGFWLYGFYITSQWTKQDEEREKMAMQDISIADSIARDMFTEYTNDKHRYDFNDSYCEIDHIKVGLKILQNAAEKGNAETQFTIGAIYAGARYDYVTPYFDSNSTMFFESPDYPRAAYWYEKAAKQGHGTAMNNLGNLYYQGEGVSQNQKLAFYWYSESAKAGNDLGELNLGDMFASGVIVRIGTQKLFGDSYWSSSGDTLVVKDLNKARELWQKSANQGNEEAKKRLERILEN